MKPGLAGEIVEMAQKTLDANIQAQTVPVRAEATALMVVTIAGSALPYVVILAAVVFAALGWDLAAWLSMIVGLATVGPHLIGAYRKAGQSSG